MGSKAAIDPKTKNTIVCADFKTQRSNMSHETPFAEKACPRDYICVSQEHAYQGICCHKRLQGSSLKEQNKSFILAKENKKIKNKLL